ncbi:MAG: DinB family protein [Bacteroidia bacterium]
MQEKSEIIEGFYKKWSEIRKLIEKLTNDQFVMKNDPKVWSVAEEFDHVLKSATAVSSAMKVSPLMLKWKFGKPNREIRTYDEAYSRYFQKLKDVKGKPVAPSTFISEEGKVFDKENMLKHWDSTLKKFEERINKWSDKNLDRVLLPHPLLGKMMVREILFFTHFHTEHHRKGLEKKISQLIDL